jgi:superfamily I DNA and/or RNA helicase
MVRWIDVRGDAVRPAAGGLVNALEAAAVVRELRRLALEQAYCGSIGVTSPFRAHVNRIRDLVQQDHELERALERLDFTVDSVHRFQGDERDLMIFAPAVSAGDTTRALGFLGSQPNVLGAALLEQSVSSTRAATECTT